MLDRINQRYGNNTVYFGAMQQALAQDAAPMRIPFSKIPETGLEQDVVTRRHGAAQPEVDDELWLQRERQLKVLAEASHREANARRKPRGDGMAPKAGAGGWLPAQQSSTPESEPPSLF